MPVILQREGHMREVVIERRATEEEVREKIEKTYGIRRGEYIVRYGRRKEFKIQQYGRITVTEGREVERVWNPERGGPITVPITVRFGERTDTTMAEEGKGEADIKAWAQQRWPGLKGKAISVTEASGKMATHAGARCTVEERRAGPPEGWQDVKVTHNGKRSHVRVKTWTMEGEILATMERERKLRMGQYRWTYDGTRPEDGITIESGTYTAIVRDGKRSITVVGRPRTTLAEVQERVRKEWALGTTGWQLEWGGGTEFRMGNRMEIQLVREEAQENEPIEVIMYKGRGIR
jgi:hypothetical protein